MPNVQVLKQNNCHISAMPMLPFSKFKNLLNT